MRRRGRRIGLVSISATATVQRQAVVVKMEVNKRFDVYGLESLR